MGYGGAGNPRVQAFPEPWAVRKAAMPDLCHAGSWSQASVADVPLFAWLFNS